ncbi:FCP1-like phosphatase [Wallemia mellicola]|nr:FCP1-like phosphatase [Wallemia mellicola]TIC75747.1 FCP1-like phosphatase [Wallemia mellicola]
MGSASDCTHPVQLSGLCAICGKDVSQEEQSESYHISHSTANLTVSYDEAQRIGKTSKHTLLKSSKLALIVDLDQTIIHATVDPTVNELLQDPTLVYKGALNDVHKFKLGDFGLVNHHEFGSWYFVKFRPGLMEFLDNMNKLFEMHVYTMGTRSYALAICQLIDPSGKYFGERILSRDESGSFTQKSLQRLFPTDTSMCVIIDDRADVWGDSPNLVKVIPFEFFVGIGDINALNKRKKLRSNQNGDGDGDQEEQEQDSNESLSKQADQRPLAKRQKEHQQILSETIDEELPRLSKILTQIHSNFYNFKNAGDDPDTKEIIPTLKRKVLHGLKLVFSSVIPLGMPLEISGIYNLASKFGATIDHNYNEKVTHVVAAKKGTAKVEDAKKGDSAHVVWSEWLLDSCAKWEKMPEENYYLDGPPNNPKQVVQESPSKFDHVDWDTADQELEDFLNEEDSEGVENEDVTNEGTTRKRSRDSPESASSINSPKRHKADSDKSSDDFDDFANELDGII